MAGAFWETGLQRIVVGPGHALEGLISDGFEPGGNHVLRWVVNLRTVLICSGHPDFRGLFCALLSNDRVHLIFSGEFMGVGVNRTTYITGISKVKVQFSE